MTTQEVSRRYATRNTIAKWLNSAKVQAYVRNALPAEIEPGRMLQVFYNLISGTPALQDCTPASLLKCVVAGSQLGLSFDANLKQAYVVPYSGVATLIIGYKGLEKLAINSGSVRTVRSFTVYANDAFTYRQGSHPVLEHTPAKGDRGKSIGAYAIARMIGTPEPEFIYLDQNEIEKHRIRSQAKDSGPWKTDREAMERKTAVRVLCGSLPLDEKARIAVTLDEQAETGQPQRFTLTTESVIDAEEILDDPSADYEAEMKAETERQRAAELGE